MSGKSTMLRTVGVNVVLAFAGVAVAFGDGYYAPDGTSKKQAFLRSPLKLARVSSGFSLSRAHPILNTRRAHKGEERKRGQREQAQTSGNPRG